MTGSGVAYLRRRTVPRALRSYTRWIGRAVGWWTVVYLLFWLVVFVIAGFESLPVPDRPLTVPLVPVISGLAALLPLSALLARGTPPVVLDRRDVYRLALSPARPYLVLRWAFSRRSALIALGGLLLGAAWTFFAQSWLGLSPWWSAPALALLLLAHFDLRWLVYSYGPAPRGSRWAAALLPLAALLALAGLLRPELGLAAALYTSSPLTLALPLLLATLGRLAVRDSLASTYPPRYASHSFILAQLHALRNFEMLSRLGGAPSGTDPFERQRLLDLLRERPSALSPARSLPLPRAGSPVWLAVAWRTSSAVYRSPLRRLLLIPVLLAAWAGAYGLLPGAGGVVIQSVTLTILAGALLGPASFPPTVPLPPAARTVGRTLPGVALVWLVLAGILLGSAPLGWPAPAHDLLLAASLVPLVFLSVEKLGAWIGSSSSPEVNVAAAILAATPAFLTVGLGVPSLAGPLQVLLVLLLLLLPV